MAELPAELSPELSPETPELYDYDDHSFSNCSWPCFLDWAKKYKKALELLAVIAVILLVFFLLVTLLPIVSYLETAQLQVNENLTAGCFVYFLCLFFGTWCFFPIALTEIFGVYVFGFQLGFGIGFAAIVLGSIACGYFTRYFYYEKIRGYVSHFGHSLILLDRIIKVNPWKISLLLRLWYIPMTAKNWLLAGSEISMFVYSVTLSLSVLPYSLLHAYIGLNATDMASVVTGLSNPKSTPAIIIIIVAIVGFFAITGVVNYYYRKALAEEQSRLDAERNASEEFGQNGNDIPQIELSIENESDSNLMLQHDFTKS